MASQVNPPRGMRDFLPVEKARREMLLSVIRRSFRAHGFDAGGAAARHGGGRERRGLRRRTGAAAGRCASCRTRCRPRKPAD